MNTTWLRSLVRRYGICGTLFVGLYLVWHHLKTRRRMEIVVSLSLSLLIGLFVVSRPPNRPAHQSPARRSSPTISPVVLPKVKPTSRKKQSLLDKATRIAITKDWLLPNGGDAQAYMTYFWRSNRHLLFFTSNDQIGELLVERDVRTGKETPFPTVSSWWSNDGWFKKLIEISPDGQWILWDGDHQDHSYHGYYGARRDGTHLFHFRRKGWPEAIFIQWLPDSRHFLEFTTRFEDSTGDYKPLRAVMRSVDAPTIAQKPPYRHPEKYDNADCHFIPGHRMIVVEEQPSRDWIARAYILEEVKLDKEPRRLHRWTIAVPRGEERLECVLSPNGDRLAWIIAPAYTSAGKQIQSPIRLCVSHLDGSALREVGRLDIVPPSWDWVGPLFAISPHELKWLPDGKRLSFLYKDALYTVPAD